MKIKLKGNKGEILNILNSYFTDYFITGSKAVILFNKVSIVEIDFSSMSLEINMNKMRRLNIPLKEKFAFSNKLDILIAS